MTPVEKRTVSLSPEQATFINEMVASGAYASASEVVRAGLRALQQQNAAIDRWLHDEVAETYDAMQADPDRAIPVQAVFDRLRRRRPSRKDDA